MNTPLWNSLGARGHETQILQEYFIPRGNLAPFLDDLRELVGKHNREILIAAIRAVRRDDASFLAYAKEDVFGVVLTLRHFISPDQDEALAEFTREVINKALERHGRFYLPYQLAYTPEQLREGYPEIAGFFELKRRYDPAGTFANKFYAAYSATASPKDE